MLVLQPANLQVSVIDIEQKKEGLVLKSNYLADSGILGETKWRSEPTDVEESANELWFSQN